MLLTRRSFNHYLDSFNFDHLLIEKAAEVFTNKILVDNSQIDKELQIHFYNFLCEYIINYHFKKDEEILVPLLFQRGFPTSNFDILSYYHNLIIHSLKEIGELIYENKTQKNMDKWEKISRISIIAVIKNYTFKEMVYIYVEASKYLIKDDIIYLQKKFQKLFDSNPNLIITNPKLEEFLKNL